MLEDDRKKDRRREERKQRQDGLFMMAALRNCYTE
jgi:hypothetical protein